MKNTILTKVAAVLALAIGAMALFAGGKVLVGIDPGYTVINWLPVYNFSVGLVTVLVTTVLLWQNHRLAPAAAISTLAFHVSVMLVRQTIYQGLVAAESVQAMTLRMLVWSVILILLFLQARMGKTARSSGAPKTNRAQEKA